MRISKVFYLILTFGISICKHNKGAYVPVNGNSRSPEVLILEQQKQETPTSFELPRLLNEGLILDIASPGKNINKRTIYSAGYDSASFIPRNGFFISSVVENGLEVWKASGNEQCLFARSYPSGAPSLLRLFVKNGEKSESKFYHKEDSVWENINRSGFNIKRQALGRPQSPGNSDPKVGTKNELPGNSQHGGDQSNSPGNNAVLQGSKNRASKGSSSHQEMPPDYFRRLQEIVPCSNEEAQSIYNRYCPYPFHTHSCRYRMLTPVGHLDLLKFKECLGLLGTLGRLVTERMFIAFDLNCDKALDFVEFASGLLIMLCGEEDKKLQLSFRILHGSGHSRDAHNTCMCFREFITLVNGIEKTRALLVSREPSYRSLEDIEGIFTMHASVCADGVKGISQSNYIKAVYTSSEFLKVLGISASRRSIKASGGYKLGLAQSLDSSIQRGLAGEHLYTSITTCSLQENKRGFSVHFGHESWNDAVSIMVGLSISTQYAYSKPGGALLEEDFATEVTFTIAHDPQLNKLSVDCVDNRDGTYSSGFADSNSYKTSSGGDSLSQYDHKIIFKEHAPLVFKEIRNISGLSASDYVESISPEQMIGNMVLGNLSTMSELVSEGKSGSLFYYTIDGKFIIKTITENHAKFLKQWLKSYHCHLNEHRDSLLTRFYSLFSIQMRGKPVHFVVMNNIFYSKVAIHRRYDLKGSWVGRSLGANESADHTVALKDCDFTKSGDDMHLGEKSGKVLDILRRDVEFLKSSNIIDYSLLLGIHSRNKSVDRVDWERMNENSLNCIMGSKREHLYYIGIIDFFTSWDWKKRFEYGWKAFSNFNCKGISCVEPNFYAQRFMEFVEKHVRSD